MNEKSVELMEQFTRLEWLFHRYHHLNHMHYGPMGDPRRGQGRILAILKMQPEISQKELSYLLDMRPQSLGEFLSKLEKNGYITRTPAENDRRVMDIKLTEEGRKASEQEFSHDRLFECLSEEERAAMSGYLSRIIEALEAELSEEQPEAYQDGGMFGGHFNWAGGKGFPGEGSGSHGGMEAGHPWGGNFDPRSHGGHRGKMPRGMHRGPWGRPAPSKDKSGEE